MTTTRRQVLRAGGGLFAALTLAPLAARAAGPLEIVMQGRPDGSHVWFDPIGLRIEPGRTVRWINRDPGNVHTSTAYHPANFDRPRRIPEGAAAWHSDYLMPEEAFEVTLDRPGVYDYYCVPHEHAGMVGRIIVGDPSAAGWMGEAANGAGLPEPALAGFPSVDEILEKGIVRRA